MYSGRPRGRELSPRRREASAAIITGLGYRPFAGTGPAPSAGKTARGGNEREGQAPAIRIASGLPDEKRTPSVSAEGADSSLGEGATQPPSLREEDREAVEGVFSEPARRATTKARAAGGVGPYGQSETTREGSRGGPEQSRMYGRFTKRPYTREGQAPPLRQGATPDE